MVEESLNLGQVIRELRRRQGLTGEELAKRAGISQPKISRIESNRTNPKAADIERILNILGATQTIRQQMTDIVQSRAVSSQKFNGYPPYKQVLEIERQSKNTYTFILNVIALLLQTVEYRQAMLGYLELGPDDKKLRMQFAADRQDMLWDDQHRYNLLLHEAALYTMPGNRRVQLAQLDRVERLLGLRHVKIGIIPVQAGLITAEHGSFTIFDEQYLYKDAPADEVVSRDATEIATYHKIFASLERLAAYDDECLALIIKAKKYFS